MLIDRLITTKYCDHVVIFGVKFQNRIVKMLPSELLLNQSRQSYAFQVFVSYLNNFLPLHKNLNFISLLILFHLNTNIPFLTLFIMTNCAWTEISLIPPLFFPVASSINFLHKKKTDSCAFKGFSLNSQSIKLFHRTKFVLSAVNLCFRRWWHLNAF